MYGNRFFNYYNSSLEWKDKLLNKKDELMNQQKNDTNQLNENQDELNKDQYEINKDQDEMNKDQYEIKELNEDQNEDQTSDLDKEFLEFILQTRKHQLQRDERKRKLIKKEKNEIEYKDIIELEIKNKFLNLKEPKLNDYLYGKQAKEIYLKELKLQFNFNEFCDKYQPNFWPLMPINLKL